MGVEELPNNGNKFTGSRMIVPGVGLNIYKVQKNDKFAVKRNQYANSINASPTPTPSFTPTNTPTPTITPTNTITPSVTPTLTPTPSSTPPLPPQTFVFSGNSTTTVSGTFTVSSSGGYIDYGDGATTSLTLGTNVINHTYSSPYTGVITINYFGNITSLNINNCLPDNSTVVNLSTSEIANLTNITSFTLSSGRLTGQFSDLSALTLLTNLNIKNDYTTSVISDIPQNITHLVLGAQGYTTISGNISALSGNNLTFLGIYGTNTVSGNISTLQSTLSTLAIWGSNTVSGNTSSFNFPSLNNTDIRGANTIGGDVANLPSSLTNLYISGYNTLFGNMSDIPISINNLTINSFTGGNLTGNLSDLQRTGFYLIAISAPNHTFGLDIDTMPNVSGTTFYARVNGDLTGDISNLFNSGLSFPYCSITIENGSGTSSSISYTPSTYPWGSVDLNTFTINRNGGLSSTIVNNLLIDIDSFGGGITWGTQPSCAGVSSINLKGTRTSASDAAVTSLNGKGVTVTITP
jgi:hypothetical protein